MKLAINGGTPIRQKPFSPWPYYDKAEEKALYRALNQGQWWRMSGNEVDIFEKEFSVFHHASGGALAVSNGTHALEVALLTLGIGYGDEVIVPAFTFISTSMAVQRVGAVAIPADVDIATYCITVDTIKPLITTKTKAVIPVHMAGHGVDMLALESFLAQKNIHIIQDACHAQGAKSQNKNIGEWNSMACFSFQNFKLMTAGEGGAITFPSQEMREKAFLIHNCGRPQNDKSYLHTELGSNYRMNEFSAAILREQLKRLADQNSTREKNALLLCNALKEIDGIIPQSRREFVNIMPYYMFMFVMDEKIYPELSRDKVVEALIAEGIPVYKNYKSIYKTDAFWKYPHPSGSMLSWQLKCPNTEIISNQGIWIHHSALLGSDHDVMDIAKAIKKVVSLL